MDKRLFDKSSNFFKKEGFYVVLFVCLCIVATVAAVTARNNKLAKNQPPVVVQPKEDLNLAIKNTEDEKTELPNALQVKNSAPSSAITVPKNGTSSTAVSNQVDTKFAKPVDGTLARAYTTDTVYCATIGTYKTNNGIEIKAALGKPVYAVLDGKVEVVDNDGTELGKYIIINHQNGLKTVYANLDEKVNVKAGDIVKKGQEIGKVGKTRGNYSDENFGDHLHFQVKKGNDYVDPAKYVTYETTKK